MFSRCNVSDHIYVYTFMHTKLSVYKYVRRIKLWIWTLPSQWVTWDILQTSLTITMFLLSNMWYFPSHTCHYLTENAFGSSSHLLSLPASTGLCGPLPFSLPSLKSFQGPEAKPKVQVIPDKVAHVFLRTVWLDPPTMATLSIFDNVPFGPELDFVWAWPDFSPAEANLHGCKHGSYKAHQLW